jgi:hypothetical protein
MAAVGTIDAAATPATTVWVHVFDGTGGQPFKMVHIPKDVNALKKAVFPELSLLDVAKCSVYAPGTAIPVDASVVPLNAWDSVPDTSGPRPLIVVAPPPQKQQGLPQQQQQYGELRCCSRIVFDFCYIQPFLLRCTSHLEYSKERPWWKPVVVSPTKRKASQNPVRPLPFKNRDSECCQLARIFLENHKKRKTRPSETGAESQFRLTLATSAQMFGSGKSTFGANFLTQINKREGYDFQTTYDKDAVTWLCNLVYVGIDFRHLNILTVGGLIHALRISLWKALSRVISKDARERVEAELYGTTVASVRCADLVLLCENHGKKSFLIHLDEVTALLPFTTEQLNQTQLLYQMWGEISQIHNDTDSELFCSGRSPTLYLLGKKALGYDQSPEDAECILLDLLAVDHVTEIFSDFKVTDEDEFVRKVHQLTAGVPRFIAHAVDFFTGRTREEAQAKGYKDKRTSFLKGSEAAFVEYLKSNARAELSPLSYLSTQQAQFYVEMIRVAALRLPLCLDETINGNMWGMEGDVMTLQVCSALPLYLQRCTESHYFVIIPPVVLDSVARCTRTQDARLPLWKSLHISNQVQARAQSQGDVLEHMAAQILRLRLSEELNQEGRSMKQMIHFLKESKIANAKFTLGAPCFRSFPKITRVTSRRARQQLQKFFQDPKDAGFSCVDPEDLGTVVKLLETGCLYIPFPKSSSADLIFKTDDGVFVEWQFKNGDQVVSETMLRDDLKKCCYRHYTQGVFVMIALTTEMSRLPLGTKVYDEKNEVIALQYDSGIVLGGFEVPKNLQVIVVLEPGLLSFLTIANVEALRKDRFNLNDVAAALRSPARKESKSK